MGLESTVYIDGLDASNPVVGDQVGAGDDHIRLIKSAVKATFPNVAGAVSPTHTELNLIDGSSAGTIVNSKAVIYGAAGEVNATTLQIGGTSITATAAELNYVAGVTSAIQTQLDTKLAKAHVSTWTEVTGNANAAADNGYYMTGNNDYTMTLPASPAAGDTVIGVCGGTGKITFGRNGKNINAKAADKQIQNDGIALVLFYSGNATVGWVAIQT